MRVTVVACYHDIEILITAQYNTTLLNNQIFTEYIIVHWLLAITWVIIFTLLISMLQSRYMIVVQNAIIYSLWIKLACLTGQSF